MRDIILSVNEIRKAKGLPPLDKPVYTFDGIFSRLKGQESEVTEDAEFEIIEPKRLEK